jgi:hypothetical protein
VQREHGQVRAAAQRFLDRVRNTVRIAVAAQDGAVMLEMKAVGDQHLRRLPPVRHHGAVQRQPVRRHPRGLGGDIRFARRQQTGNVAVHLQPRLQLVAPKNVERKARPEPVRPPLPLGLGSAPAHRRPGRATQDGHDQKSRHLAKQRHGNPGQGNKQRAHQHVPFDARRGRHHRLSMDGEPQLAGGEPQLSAAGDALDGFLELGVGTGSRPGPGVEREPVLAPRTAPVRPLPLQGELAAVDALHPAALIRTRPRRRCRRRG